MRWSWAIFLFMTLAGIIATVLGWGWITGSPERATVISAALATYFVSLGLLFAARQFSLAERQHYWDLTFDVITYWDSDLMSKSRAAINEAINAGTPLADAIDQSDKDNPTRYIDLMRVGNFCEHLAYTVDKGAIDPKMVKAILGPAVKYYFAHYSPYKEKVKDDQPELFDLFKKLAKKC